MFLFFSSVGVNSGSLGKEDVDQVERNLSALEMKDNFGQLMKVDRSRFIKLLVYCLVDGYSLFP